MFEELFELLTDTKDDAEALQFMKELADKIEANPGEAIYELDEFIRNTAVDHNICPRCFGQMLPKTYEESSEYEGRPVSEKIYVPTCIDCGLEID
jgi:hypothetical protein